MPNIDYLKIFYQALKITWNNRFLWWFGFFTLLTGIPNSNYFFPNQNEKASLDWQKFQQQFKLQEFIADHAQLFVILGIIALSLFLVALLLSFVSKGALIKSTQRLIKKETISFATGWKDGQTYFWANFKITLCSFLALAFCLLVLIVPVIMLFLSKAYFIAIPLTILAIFIIIPLVIIYQYIQTYGCLYATLANLRPWLAVENAYALFKKNILSSIIMSLLFIPISLLSFFAIIALGFVLLIVFGLIGLLLYLFFSKVGVVIAVTGAVLLFVFCLILFYSFFLTFSQIAWVLFFYAIATPKEKEKVEEKVSLEEAVENLPTTETIKTIKTEK